MALKPVRFMGEFEAKSLESAFTAGQEDPGGVLCKKAMATLQPSACVPSECLCCQETWSQMSKKKERKKKRVILLI